MKIMPLVITGNNDRYQRKSVYVSTFIQLQRPILVFWTWPVKLIYFDYINIF